MTEYHPITKVITDLLTKEQCWFETFEHEPVRTSEEAAKVRTGYTLEQGAKAIIIRVKKTGGEKYFVMLVLPADSRFDSEKVKTLLETKDIRFATKEEIAILTNGIEIGGIPPFGNLFQLQVIADPILLENKKIIFNAGDRKFSVAMKAEDYKNIVRPTITAITST